MEKMLSQDEHVSGRRQFLKEKMGPGEDVMDAPK